MRILTLANTPLRRDLGSGYVILNYAERLRRRGHVVRLIGPPEIDWPRSGRRAIRYRQMAGMFLAAAPDAIAKYDVVEFYGGESWLAVTRLARRSQRPLLVAHSNGLEPHAERLLGPLLSRRRRYQLDLSRLYAQAFRGADGLATVSDFDRDFALAENYLPPERVISINNPLPEEFLGQPMNGKREPAVVVSGSWIPRKGCQLIRDAIPGFLRSCPGWRLTLVGVGDAFSAASQFPGDCLAQIEVIPHADRLTGLRSLLKNSAIALQASHYESFGLAAAEAMASGCALVATAVGFAASLRHGEEAWLLADGAMPSDLTNALRRLASDPATRQRIASGGHRRAQQLTWEGAVDRYEEFLLGLSRK